MPYFGEPLGRVKIQTTSKNSLRYYTTKRLIKIYYPTRQIGMFVRANFVDIYLQRMRDRSMRGGGKLVREIKLTDWSTAANLSNRSSGVQIPRDICTRLKRYLIVLCEVQLDNKPMYFINTSRYLTNRDEPKLV